MVGIRYESQIGVQNLVTYNSHRYQILLHLEGKAESNQSKNDMHINVYY